jgi:TPR repeat protein
MDFARDEARHGGGLMKWRTRALAIIAAGYSVFLAQDVSRAAGASGQPIARAGAQEAVAPASREFARVREAAVGGDAQAQYDLAVGLDCGRGVKKDRTSSLDWLQRAAEQGHVQAQGALGWRYMAGSGARRDDSAAYEWLRRAAERGNTSAQNNLGVLYAQGRGVAADPVEAAKWFRLAAEKGAQDAQRNLDALLAGRRREARKGTEPPLPRT